MEQEDSMTLTYNQIERLLALQQRVKPGSREFTVCQRLLDINWDFLESLADQVSPLWNAK